MMDGVCRGCGFLSNSERPAVSQARSNGTLFYWFYFAFYWPLRANDIRGAY